MADPLTTALVVSSLLGTGQSLFGGTNTQINQTPATPAGGQVTPTSTGPNPVQVPQQPALPNLDQNVAAATAAQPQAPPPPAPLPELVGPPAPGDDPLAIAQPDIGQILAAIGDPEVMTLVANLLGLNQTDRRSERPAPPAGGQPGQVVGQFGQGSPQDSIGQLLAALPGIR